MLVREIYNHNPSIVRGSTLGSFLSDNGVGIEIEMENMPEPPSVSLWSCLEDASLRNNGIEYVLKSPRSGSELDKAIDYINEELKSMSPIYNGRCSTHIHLDFNDNTIEEVGKFAAIFALYEDYLFTLCDPSRTDNPYCVPVRDSFYLKRFIKEALTGSRHCLYSEALSSNFRYGSINFSSLSNFGSVEVRIKEGLHDKEGLTRWINTLLGIKEHSLKCNNVFEEFIRNPLAFTSRTFPELPMVERYVASGLAIKTYQHLSNELTKISDKELAIRSILLDKIAERSSILLGEAKERIQKEVLSSILL